MAISDYEKKIIEKTSTPHPDRDGDTHVHPFPEGVVITDRFQGGGYAQTRFDNNGNPKD